MNAFEAAIARGDIDIAEYGLSFDDAAALAAYLLSPDHRATHIWAMFSSAATGGPESDEYEAAAMWLTEQYMPFDEWDDMTVYDVVDEAISILYSRWSRASDDSEAA